MNNILITGAASGIGAATARIFHKRGWKVGLLDVNEAALSQLAAELNGAWHQPLDVTDLEAVQDAVKLFAEAHDGQLRLLFNCAGILRFGYFAEIEPAAHAQLLQINVQGVINMTHAAFTYLKQTSDAQVINMGSASGLYGVQHMATYSASKFAVRGLTEALNLEWERYGISVGDLMPPFVNTPMVTSKTFSPPVLKRLGVNLAAEDIAEACWQQAHQPRVHRPISLQFKLLYWSGQISPVWLTRLVMRWLGRD